MARAVKAPPLPKAPKPLNVNKAVNAAPRLKPVSTRDYGKGGTPYSSFPRISTNYDTGLGGI